MIMLTQLSYHKHIRAGRRGAYKLLKLIKFANHFKNKHVFKKEKNVSKLRIVSRFMN